MKGVAVTMNMDIKVYQYLNNELIEANRTAATEADKAKAAERIQTNSTESSTKASTPTFAETYDLAKRAIQAVDIDSTLASLKQAGETGINLNSKLAYDLGIVTAYSYLENKANAPSSNTIASNTSPVELHGASCLTKEINSTSHFPSHTGTNGSDNSGVLQCSDEMQQYFNQAAAYTGLDIKLIKAVAFRETSFTNITSSGSGALGVMALMPEACADYGVTDVNNMEQNIMAGASILADNLNYYNGNLELSLAAYNAGRGNIARNGNAIPSYCEKYVNDIINFYNS